MSWKVMIVRVNIIFFSLMFTGNLCVNMTRIYLQVVSIETIFKRRCFLILFDTVEIYVLISFPFLVFLVYRS